MSKAIYKKLHAVQEEWRDIPGFEGYYQVSNLGRVRGVDRYFFRHGFKIRVRGRIMKEGRNRGREGGYKFVGLNKDGLHRQEYVHRLVAKAFIPNPTGLKCINHKDRDITNNEVGNLEWCTVQYNVTYGGAHLVRGDKMKKAVLVFNKDGSLLGEFGCCADVGRFLGMWPDTIYRYMSGKHKNKDGLTFKYKDSQYEPRK